MKRLLAVCCLMACGEDEPPPQAIVYPRLIVRADQKQELLTRRGDEPYATLYQRIQAHAAEDYRVADATVWDWRAFNKNACIAQAAAFLAWLEDDAVQAEKARQYFRDLTTDYENHNSWDLNIRLPYSGVCGPQAWDLLMGTPFFPAEEASAAQDKLSHIAEAFFDQYVMQELYRYTALVVTQNNHPLRTASLLTLAGLAFPDDPRADEWLGWALAEYDYLYSERGHYIQAEGGVSEGPHYYFFGLGAVMAALIAAENGHDDQRLIKRNCLSRNEGPPWHAGDCVDGSTFAFDNPLHRPAFRKAMDWSIALRMGDGRRPSIADSGLNNPNGIALMGGFGEGQPYDLWDWQSNQDRPMKTTGSMQLTIQHFAHLPRPFEAAEPPWKNRFMPESGYAIFRSGWDPQARLGVLMAEHGPARLTLHDHVDATSFLIEAYGEYLVIDTGYYKPNDLDNARTAHAPAHNVILIDGAGAPRKGLLNDWGGADAFLENSRDGVRVAYSEARQTYQDTTIVRSMIFVGERYWVVADRLSSAVEDSREHRWRLHAGAGRDLGGSVRLTGDRAVIERPKARLDLALASPAGAVAFEAPPFEANQAPYVHDISGHGHHEVMDGVIRAVAPGFLSLLVPTPTGEDPPTIDALPAPAGSVAFAVRLAGRTDIIWLREVTSTGALTVDGRRLTTDAALLVLHGVDAGVMAQGSQLTIDATVVVDFDGPKPVHHWENAD